MNDIIKNIVSCLDEDTYFVTNIDFSYGSIEVRNLYTGEEFTISIS
jgi:hypothetical protein